MNKTYGLIFFFILVLSGCQNTLKVNDKEYSNDTLKLKVFGFGKEQQVAYMNAQGDYNIILKGAAFEIIKGKVTLLPNNNNPVKNPNLDGYFNTSQKKLGDKLFIYEYKELSGTIYIQTGKKHTQESEVEIKNPDVRVLPVVITDAIEKKYADNKKASGVAYVRGISYDVSKPGKIFVKYSVTLVEENVE